MKRIYYENSRGEILELNSGGVLIDPTELFKWEFETATLNKKLIGFSRKIATRSAKAVIAKGFEKRNDLYEIPAVDIDANSPGKLWYGEWYLTCFLNSSAISFWYKNDGSAVYSLSFVTDEPYWRRDTRKTFTEIHDSVTNGLDYPYDFAFDYGVSKASDVTFNNKGFIDSDLVIRVYGYAENPYIRIAGNLYQVNATINNNEFLEIDTEKKKVILVKVDGKKESVFSRIRGTYKEGSGSYIFQKAEPGVNQVSWSGVFDFDVVVRERRAEPEWS